MKKLALLLTLLIPIFTFSQIINIPDDEPTIQSGINAATEGDTVLVAEDTYYENINFNGKKITVASEFILDNDTSHISNTIIDGSQPDNPDFGSVVMLTSGEDTASVICGFTITGGTGTSTPGFNARAGGGVYCYPAGGKIINNIVENNSVTTSGEGYGGGILCDHEDQSWAVIRNNIVRNNHVEANSIAQGAGIGVYGNAVIENNDIINNTCESQFNKSSGGIACQGGFYNTELKELILRNNFIANNKAYSFKESGIGSAGGGIFVMYYLGVISNNTVSGNEISAGEFCYGAGVYLEENSTALYFENNIVQDNFYTNGICYGGGIGVTRGEATLINNVINNNIGSYGGGVYFWAQNTDNVSSLINNTICANEATVAGGGLLNSVSNLIILNTIIWGNTSPDGESIYVEESLLEVRYSNIEGEEEWPGQGNMNIDPEFRHDGYHLYFPSLLVNEGKSSIQINGEHYDAPEYDIDGEERPFDGTYPDIGADEAQWYYTSIDESIETQNLIIHCFPNPFSTTTTIEYELTRPETVTITFYNQFGKQVDVVEQRQSPGSQRLVWTPENLADGVYYFRLKAGEKVTSGKVLLVK